MNLPPYNVLTFLKVIVFLYIIISPFFNYSYVSFLNTLFAKVLLLALIVVASFIDLQLAVLLTLAFLILIINLNKTHIFGVQKSKGSSPSMSEHFATGLPIEVIQSNDNITNFPDDDMQCSSEIEKEKISNDLFGLYIDPKIKPYEMYIKQLSSPDKIENASNADFYTT